MNTNAHEKMEPSLARSDISTTPSSTSGTTSPVTSAAMSPTNTEFPWTLSPTPPSQSALQDVRPTRMFVISDTHSLPWSVPKGHFDFVVCLGDHTDRSTKQEFEEFIGKILQIDTDHVFLIFGHEYSTDHLLSELKYPKFPGARLQHWERYLTKDYALQLCRENGIILLDEGCYEFHLNNGTTAKLYASPYTPKRRKSPFNGYRYKRREKDGQFGHDFNMGSDIDLVFTHGPPEGILDDSGTTPSLRGCKDLLEAVVLARPRVHCFGHNHAGWGATLVDWEKGTGDKRLLNIGLAALDLTNATKIDLVEGKDLASLKQIDAESSNPIGCCRLYHSSQDRHPIQKGSTTLFVNAAYEGVASNSEGEKATHMPMIVQIDLPVTVNPAAEGTGIQASLKKSTTSQNTLVPGRSLVFGQPGSWMPPHKRQNSLDKAISAMQAMVLSDTTSARPDTPTRVSSPSSEVSPIESNANKIEETVTALQHDHPSRPEGKTTRHCPSEVRKSPIEMVAPRQGRAGAWGVVGTEKHNYRPCDGSRAVANNGSRTYKMSKPSTSSTTRLGLGMQAISSRLCASQVVSNRNSSTDTVARIVHREEGQPSAESANQVGRRGRDSGAEPEIKSKVRSDEAEKGRAQGRVWIHQGRTTPESPSIRWSMEMKAPAEERGLMSRFR